MPKSKPSSASTEGEPSFEEAFAELESVVRAMESDQLPLGELIESYEKGTQLHRICEKRLEEAHDRIEIIRQKAGGELTTEPFDPEADAPTAAENKPAPKKKKSLKDGELF